MALVASFLRSPKRKSSKRARAKARNERRFGEVETRREGREYEGNDNKVWINTSNLE